VFLDLADAAEQLGHVSLAIDALRRYIALGGEGDDDSAVSQRLARLQP
jgi:hypothetical protein